MFDSHIFQIIYEESKWMNLSWKTLQFYLGEKQGLALNGSMSFPGTSLYFKFTATGLKGHNFLPPNNLATV